jgi:hypothetical protein
MTQQYNTGRWSVDEHTRFLKACYDHKDNWEKVKTNLTQIEAEIATRSKTQILSHAQKYLISLCRKHNIKLSNKKFKTSQSVHLDYKVSIGSNSPMDKYDKNILETFRYYNRSYISEEKQEHVFYNFVMSLLYVNKSIINCLGSSNNDGDVINWLLELKNLYGKLYN